MPRHPVSRNCPHCGSRKFRTTTASGFIAYQKDRVCKRCKTRYTPPTPVWAGIVFLIVGLLLAVVGFGAILLRTAQSEVRTPPPMGAAAVGILGVACIVQGVRSFRGSR